MCVCMRVCMSVSVSVCARACVCVSACVPCACVHACVYVCKTFSVGLFLTYFVTTLMFCPFSIVIMYVAVFLLLTVELTHFGYKSGFPQVGA